MVEQMSNATMYNICLENHRRCDSCNKRKPQKYDNVLKEANCIK